MHHFLYEIYPEKYEQTSYENITEFTKQGTKKAYYDYGFNDFNFSVENLADKMDKEFGINIMNSNNVINIVRGMEQEHIKEPIYIIYAHIIDKLGYIRNYLISGRTGSILFVLDSYGEEPKSVIDEYLNTLKN